MNEGGDLERESFKLSSRPTVGQFLAPDRRRNRGPGLPGIWRTLGLHEGPVPCPHPMPALLAAGSSGLRLLGRSQSCIFGECFTLGNGPGILKERPPPSPAKVSLSRFRKEVPRKDRQQSGSLFRPPSRILQQRFTGRPSGARMDGQVTSALVSGKQKQALEMD